jgi:hypothetical protein
MTSLIQICFVLLLSISAYAAPAIQYQHDLQRYTFPEKTVSSEVFFTEFSQYSGVSIYYYPKLIIPDIFRGSSLQEDEIIRILEKQFSLIKSFETKQLASIQILPEGEFKSGNLRLAGSPLVETSQSSDTLQALPVLLSDQRIRVLKVKAKREQAVAELQNMQNKNREKKDKKRAEIDVRKAEKRAKKQAKELSRLKHFRDTDKEIYQRLLPFYQHRFGQPDFSEMKTTGQP